MMRYWAIVGGLVIGPWIDGCAQAPCSPVATARAEVAKRDPNAVARKVSISEVDDFEGLNIVSMTTHDSGARHPGAIAAVDPDTCAVREFKWVEEL
jgi:hypothetical protein